MKFKVGDKVILITKRYTLSESNPSYDETGVIGIILRVWLNSKRYRVGWDNGNTNSYIGSDLEKFDNRIIDVDDLFKDIDI